ncbi:MAG: hypothetical protein OET44_21130, partial [Gammaproteobacteria bacterium]|nr:hypothetical protein [Gammaproteobacteria bacterium]
MPAACGVATNEPMHELEKIHHILRCRTDPGAPALIDCDGTQLRNGDLYAAVAAATDLLRENGVAAG